MRSCVDARQVLFRAQVLDLTPPLREPVRRAWISEETWAAIDARVTARWEGAQRTIRKLGHQIRTGISIDWKRGGVEAGRTIESLLMSDHLIVR